MPITTNAPIFQTNWQPVIHQNGVNNPPHPPPPQNQGVFTEYMINPMTPIPSAANIPPPNSKPPQKPM